MSALTLVRHGQASLFAKEYDRLSEIGEQQGRLLGQYWAAQRLPIDAVFTGPRLRQQQSAELAGEQYQQAGLAWPEPCVVPELDEYDLHGLLHHVVPRYASEHDAFAQLVAQYRQSPTEQERGKNFQRMFEMLLVHWQNTKSPDPNVESWNSFQQRVTNAMERIQQTSGRGTRTVLFTSGGFISVVVQRALGVSNRTTLELSWRIRNSSLTEFLFTSERFTLDAFNTLPHLADPALWTFR